MARFGFWCAVLLAIAALGGLPVAATAHMIGGKEIPHATSPPRVLGTPAIGSTLTCDRGEWPPEYIEFTYFWHQTGPGGSGGIVSPGGVPWGDTFTVRSSDNGQLLACSVTAWTADRAVGGWDIAESVLVPATGTDKADEMTGTAGRDTFNGGAGDDVLLGRGGDDLLRGAIGTDRLTGDAGDDRLEGGRGSDTLSGGEGKDQLLGGAGNDTIYANDGVRGNDKVNCGPGTDLVVIDAAAGGRRDFADRSCETVVQRRA